MTDHDLPPAQARVRQSSETDGPDGMRQMKKALIGAITAALTSLAVSIPAIVKSCEAQNTAGEAKSTADDAAQVGHAGAQVAQAAKLTSDIAYDRTKDKVDDAGDSIQQIRADLNVLLAERAALLEKAKGGANAETVPPKDVPPSLGRPLPPTPDAAAAAAGVPVAPPPIKETL